MKLKWFYKGIRIRKSHRYILPKMIGTVILIPQAFTLFINWKLQNHDQSSGMLIKSLVTGIGITAIISLMMYRLWYRLYDIQKLCNMIYDSIFYNLEGEIVDGKIVNSRKDMTYFPKIYYRYKRKKVKISIKLDGSRYHKTYQSMEDTLSEMFDMEVTRAVKKLWYKVYTLEAIAEDRLHMGKDKIDYKRNAIPIMKNLLWKFKSAPHALITGVTGGGKSYFLFYLIRSLKKIGAIVKIIDPKRSDLYGLRKILGEENVTYAVGKVMVMMREIMKEMDRRYEALDQAPFGADYESIGLKPYFLIFDEFIAFIEGLQKAEDHKNLLSYLTRIVLEGRQAGIFVIYATQRPDAKYLPGAIRDNLGLRMSLGSLEKSGYRMTFGDVDRDFEKFDKGHGYIYINGTTTTVRESYAPYLGEDYDPLEDLRTIQSESHGDARSASSGSAQGDSDCPSEP